MDSDGLDTWPYKDLVGQRISRMERGDTHFCRVSRATFWKTRDHNSHRRQGSARRASHAVDPNTTSVCVRVCVWTFLLLQGWLDALRTLVDCAKIIHTNQHSEDNRLKTKTRWSTRAARCIQTGSFLWTWAVMFNQVGSGCFR